MMVVLPASLWRRSQSDAVHGSRRYAEGMRVARERIHLDYLPREGVERLDEVSVQRGISLFAEALGDAGTAHGTSGVIAAHVDVAGDYAAARGSAIQIADQALDSAGLCEHFRLDGAR